MSQTGYVFNEDVALRLPNVVSYPHTSFSIKQVSSDHVL